MRVPRGRSVLVLALLGTALASVALSAGDLTYQGPATGASLDGATAVAVSPDGAHVYVASDGGLDEVGDAVTRMDRDAQTGSLTFGQCFTQDAAVPANCTLNQVGLAVPSDVALSPNGQTLYVTTAVGNAIVWFTRNTSSGALTRSGCIAQVAAGDCSLSPFGGLGEPSAVAVSPDGTGVYVTSVLSNSVAHFSRATNGALMPVACFSSGATGNTCAVSNLASLASANDVTVSPDGASVYVTGTVDPQPGTDALTAFTRDSTTGALAYQGCFTADAGCGTNQTVGLLQMQGPSGVAVSPDGKSVYVAAILSSAVQSFTRAANGALSAQGCVILTTGCGAGKGNGFGLAAANGVEVSGDGRSVYVSASDPAAPGALGAVSRLDRAPDGSLSYIGCFTSLAAGGCGVTGNDRAGLGGAGDVALSPNGQHVYVASDGGGTDVNSAITAFGRALDAPPSACSPPATVSTPNNAPVQITLGCSDPNGDAVTADFPQAPAHGTITPGGLFTPQAGYVGPDSFTVRGVDGFGVAGLPTLVSVTITAPAAGGGGTTGGGTTGGGTLGTSGRGANASKVTISGLSLTRSFRPLRAGASLAAKGPATLSFSLSAGGTVTFRVEKLVKGRKVGTKCVAKAKTGSACTAVQTIAGRFGYAGKAGGNKVLFTGRVGGRALLKGNYRLVAETPDGKATVNFSIL